MDVYDLMSAFYNTTSFASNNIDIFLQIIVSFVILNVWLFRSEKPSKFRGSTAKNLREEFVKYGLSDNCYKCIKFVKPAFALILLFGTIFPYCTQIGAIGLSILLFGSIWMHYRVRDKFIKYIPALFLFSICILIIFLD